METSKTAFEILCLFVANLPWKIFAAREDFNEL